MKKLRLYLAATTLASALLACGGGSTPGQGSASANAATQPGVAASATVTTEATVTTAAQVTAAAGTCAAVTWTAGVNYPLGTVVLYAPNGQYYKVVNVGTNGSDATTPTISTWYWATTTCAPTTPAPPTTPDCGAVTWTAGVNYALGAVVRYPPNGNYYKVVNVGTNGSDATTPTISTWYWTQTTCSSTPAAGKKIVAGYYPNWTPAPLRIRDINARYNVIYLFAATPVGGAPGTTGAVTWTAPGDGRGAATNLKADIAYARATQGRKIMLSVGGAGNGMSFPNRSKSQAFVNSIVAIYQQLGGIDGMDWNTFEGSQAPDTSEMIWISRELKRLYPGFLISAPPAPWNPVDQEFCRAMVAAGAMDYAAPQYYDGPDLATPAYVVTNVRQWVTLLGASHVVVGFGINNATNYMTGAQAVSAWSQVKNNSPDIGGAFDWEINTDEMQGWPFANGVGPLINP